MSSDDSSRSNALAWKAVSSVAGVVGAVATRKLTNAVWSAFSSSSSEPPLNPADRQVSWPEALQWAVAAGVGAGIGRLVSQRVASAGWESATGTTPPGVTA